MTTADLVVVLPGILGSTLRANGRLIWAPSAGALLRGLLSFGESVKRYELPPDIGDEHPGDGVEPVALMPDRHVIPGIWSPLKGYDSLIRHIQRLGFRLIRDHADAPPGDLLLAPYDWRLSNRYNGKRLASLVEPALDRWRAQGGRYADAQVIFVCHSMGGLVARWYIERCGGAEVTRKLITLGTPYRGAVKALEQLVNGVPLRIGPLAANFTEFAHSLPSLHQLLPEYACVEHRGRFLKLTETTIPGLASRKVEDALRFHSELQKAETDRPASLDMSHAIVGIRQPTWTTARIDGQRITPLPTFGADNDYGDSTVPLAGALGHDLPNDTNRVRRVADKHGNLQRNQGALDEVEEVLTAQPVRRRAPRPVKLRVSAPELATAGQPVRLSIDIEDESRHAVRVTVTDERGRLMESRLPRVVRRHAETTFDELPPGAATIDVTGLGPGSPIAPVSSDILVWPRDREIS